MTYRESIIPKAIEAYARMDRARRVSKMLFVNITQWTGGPKPITGVECFLGIDAAAVTAASEDDYCGTVAVLPHGDPVMLDLRSHGAAVIRENEEEKAAEEAMDKENQGRFNER